MRDTRKPTTPSRLYLAFALLFFVVMIFLPQSAVALSIGDRVSANAVVNVRSTAAGSFLGTQASGNQGSIVGGPQTASLSGTSYTWWNVNWDAGVDGWVADIGLTFVAPTPTVSGISPSTFSSSSLPYSAGITVSGTSLDQIASVKYSWTGATSGTANGAWASSGTTSRTLNPGVLSSGDPSGTSTWTVRFYDSLGIEITGTSKTFTVTYSPVAATPTVSGISPSTFSSSSLPYSAGITVSGTSLDQIASVKYSWTGATSGTANGAWASSGTTSRTLNPGVLSSGDPSGTSTWTVRFYDSLGIEITGTSKTFTVTYSPVAATPTATTSTATSIGSTGATLNGIVNANNASTTVMFDYGTTTSYGVGVTASQSPVSGSVATSVSATISIGYLAPNTTYHYRTVATNSGGTSYGSDMTFTTLAVPPTATTILGTPSSTSALLSGSVNPNGSSTYFWFDWGLSASYGNSTVSSSAGSIDAVSLVSGQISNLTPGATYHFRVVAQNSSGTTYGSDLTFAMPVVVAVPPTVTTGVVQNMGSTYATLEGSVNPNGASADIWFEWGATTGYGNSTTIIPYAGTGTTDIPTSYIITGLLSGVTYHYRLVAKNTAGTSYGTDLTVTMAASIVIAAPSSYQFILTWGVTGIGNGQFSNPYGVAVDSSGNVYVADTLNNRIQKFDSGGGYLTQWGIGGAGNGQFGSPYGITVDSSGFVYVADTNNDRIQKFDSNGTYLIQWGSSGGGDGQFNSPVEVVVDSFGNVYVTDTGNSRIQKFDSNGNYITQWGSRGSGDGQFLNPYGVAVDSSGNVYVADTSNYRIQKFDSTGHFITKWGSNGTGDGQFNQPLGVAAIDTSGNICITDAGNRRIQKFDLNGHFITKWGSYGTGDGQFNSPFGVAVDSLGNVYVADALNNRIQKFGLMAGDLPILSSELITNGSFSSGFSGWTLQGVDSWAGTNLNNYLTSPGYAALGVDGNGLAKDKADGAFYQTVSIPANVATATLGFWYYISTNETSPSAYDYLYVTVRDSSGNFLADVATLSNVDKTTGYLQKTFDLSLYIGQTIRIRFGATTDLSKTTTFRIDDVSVKTDTVNTTAPGIFSGSLTATPKYWSGDSQDPAGAGIQLTWGDASNASGYDIYRDNVIIKPDFVGTSFWNITGLTAGQTYTYYVIAKNSYGNRKSNEVSIVASLPAGISGMVTSGGAGLGNVSMALSGAAAQTVFSGTDGSYLFSPLVDGSYTVTPSKTGYNFNPSSLSAPVAGTKISDQNFKACSTSNSLSGIVKDAIVNSIVPSGTTVTVDNNTYSALTDSSGFYTFSNLPCGIHTVTVIKSGYFDYNKTVDISATPTHNISLTKSETTLGANNNSPKSLDPVNTATGNYIFTRKDIEIPGRGMSFVFERNYNSQDAQDGPLGFGWNHNYNSSLAVNVDSSVTIRLGDGKTVTYAPDGFGGYTPQYGVFDTLIDNGDGTHTVIEKDQTSYSFNAANKLSSVVDKNGNAITLAYTGNNLTQIIDTVGRAVTFTYDSNNRITRLTDPIGRMVKFTYDVNGDLVSSTDMNGNVTWHTYDANHQMLSANDPRGNVFVTNVYDALLRVVASQKDAKLGQSTFTYDAANRKTTVVDQMNYSTVYYYDDLLRLIQETDALGNSTYYTYDSAGNRTETKNKNVNATKYGYDNNGNVITKTDAHDNVTTIEYDANNNPLTRTDALNKQTFFEYDAKGNLKKTIDPFGKFTAITYNAYGQPLTITDANGNATSNTYDNEGNLIEIADALGNKTIYTYDGAGRKLTEKDALGRITHYAYDNNNNLLTVTNPLGYASVYTYDGNNNKLTARDPVGNTTSYAYDVKDLLETVTDPASKTIVYAYDPLDRKISAKDKNGNITNYTYDEVGRLITVTDALTNQTGYTYDANGNKETETNQLGKTTKYKYDKLNRVVKVTDPLQNSVKTSFDKLGRVESTTDANDHATNFEYDDLGRLIKVTDADSGTVTYTYDANGNRLSMKNLNGNTTTYTYDALNRLIKKIEPLGQYQYAYDAVGNRLSVQDPKGQTIYYAYDGLNRLVKITYPDASDVSFTYNANGNRVSMTDSLGKTTYQYDALNRMTAYTDPFGQTVGYGYDANGNRTALTYPDGKTVNYTYDSLNRLETVKAWLTKITTYSYDIAGRLSGAVNPNNTTAAYTYDDDGRLTGLTNSKSDATVISSYVYTFDPAGNHSQAVQNEPLTPNVANQNLTYVYDADNRLTSAGGAVITHDANGNMTAKGSDTFTYDYNDRLTQSNIGGVVSQYSYDGLGNRFVRTEGDKTTRYILDVNGSLSTVLAETDASGNITAYYVYGLGLISKIQPDGTARYYHYDSKGSAVALTDASQSITDSYAYDPFGRLANSAGSTANPFKYVARYGLMDEGNGLIYIRARYYSPELGRFITKDLKMGKDGDGQTLNRYIYAVNNPVRFVDVSGYSAQEGGFACSGFVACKSSKYKQYKNFQRQAEYEYIAALQTEAAYWDAWVNTLEATGGAIDAVGALFKGDAKGVVGGMGQMGSVLIRSLGYEKTSQAMDKLLKIYKIYEIVTAAEEIPEQLKSAKSVANAIKDVGIQHVKWGNFLKADAMSGVGKLWSDTISLPMNLYGLPMDIYGVYKDIKDF